VTETLESHVRQTDAFTWNLERDPLLRSTIVAVAVLDRSPDWDRLVERIDGATRINPTFRERLEPTPLRLAPPRWIVDADFDLSWHLSRIEAPPPKTLETLYDLARHAGMQAFDPARPLWEFTLVEGLEEGRAALLLKVHHALTDGLGGIQLAAHVVDFDREGETVERYPDAPQPRSHDLPERLIDGLSYDLHRVLDVGRGWATALPGAVVSAVRDPVGTVGDLVETAQSLARFVQPINDTLSPVMTDRRLQWHFETLDVPTEPLKAAARQVGGTLNDSFVGGVTGGLRRYHERHGAPVDALRLTMPISVRSGDDPEGGNRVTLVRFEVPVGIEDAAERMRALDELVAERRRERAIEYSNAVAGVLNLLPSAFTGSMLKHVDFLASNVSGFADPVYLAGARLEAFYPFGPTLGSAANITLMSYRGTCHLGINTDVGAVADPEVFRDCLREGFDEVLALADAPA
jgi:WS/DGAT/MGAT family acyltransferase